MWQDLTLSDKARMIDLAVKSGITDLATIQQVYNTFAEGGNLNGSDSNEEEPTERRKVGDHYLTLEQYKELQRDTIRQAAVQKALTRTRGVAPIIDGKPASSCIYTFTDNYGRKYQVAGTQTFAANPEKYGFEVAGPVKEGMEGNMYLMLNESGVPYHATMITGYTGKGEPLLTYSSGHAGVDLTGVPISREDWDRNQRAAESFQRSVGLTPERETYEHYVERFNRSHSPEADYHKNTKAWHSPQYETYRFIGTPDDNALWEQQYGEYEPAPTVIGVPTTLNNQVRLFGTGGDKDGWKNWLHDRAVDLYYNVKIKPAIKRLGLDEVRLRLYDHIDPFGYENARERVDSALNTPPLNEEERYACRWDYNSENKYRDDIFRTYLGIPEELSHDYDGHSVVPSLYRPTISSNPDTKYYTIEDDYWSGLYSGGKKDQFVNNALFGSKNIPESNSDINPLNYGESRESDVFGRYFGNHTISRGVDPQRGDYISFYDLWDLAPTKERGAEDESHGIGVPINFYDRLYLDDYFNVDSRPSDPDALYGGYITPSVVSTSKADGGPIHIKKENRGKLTALKKRTGKSASWFKAHGTPAQKKMATFALNAKKWKHENGGYLMTKL